MILYFCQTVIVQGVFGVAKISAKPVIICQLKEMPPQTRAPNPDRSIAHSGRALLPLCPRLFTVSWATRVPSPTGLNACMSPRASGG